MGLHPSYGSELDDDPEFSGPDMALHPRSAKTFPRS